MRIPDPDGSARAGAAVYEQLRADLGKRRVRRIRSRFRGRRWYLGGSFCTALVAVMTLGPDDARLPQSAAPGERAAAPVASEDLRARWNPPAERSSVVAESPAPAQPVRVDPGAGDAAFYVRVATFRNASNARRLAASLGEREPGVVLESLPGGLQAVVLGPFSARPMAAAAAEGIDQETGLASQVVVRLFP